MIFSKKNEINSSSKLIRDNECRWVCLKGFPSNKGDELLKYKTHMNVKLPLNECQIIMRHHMLWGFEISLLTTWYLRIEKAFKFTYAFYDDKNI